MSAPTHPRTIPEIEDAISKAFHGGEPTFVIRRLQAQRAALLGKERLAEQCHADADYMETFGQEAWHEATRRPAGVDRTEWMRAEVAAAKSGAKK